MKSQSLLTGESNVIRKSVLAVLFSLLLVAPAFANDPHITTGDPSASASASAAASASAVGVAGNIENKPVNTFNPTNVNVNAPEFNNSNKQSQSQGQEQVQSQRQRQNQNQNNNQNIAPSQSVEFKDVVQDRIPATVVAPGLTAAGTGVCLGSVSIGISGPMAGASFGITKVDQGCELRSNAALLYQMGYKDAAVRLLMKNDDVKNALGAEAPVAAKTAAVPGAAVTVAQEQVQPIALTIPEAMKQTQQSRVDGVQSN
jgi:hypothetical protein